MSDRQTCPRRMYEMGPWERREDLDTWLPGVHTVCSFCGSLKPSETLDGIRAGWEIVPTDKPYKVYVRQPGHSSQVKAYLQHLSEDQRREFIALYNDHTMKLGEPGYFYTMPFFMRPITDEESSP